MSRSLATINLALCALLAALTLPAAAMARARDRTIVYRGHAVDVPSGWPVYNLAADPSVCVRFNRLAVYLGLPGADQRCPANAIGRSRAILIEPAGRGVAVRRTADAVVPAARAVRPPIRARTAAAATTGPYTGLGFDACSAPSLAHMAAWQASPFRAIGIYIGGANMACAQSNLDAAWVQQESAAGWYLIPTYVGLQAPQNSCGCQAIDPSQAAAQGSAAATDAAGRAFNLGIGQGNPIYLDMEFYPRTATNTSAVLEFEDAWTSQLHAYGYRSGIYGSFDSAIADLTAEQGTSYPEPDDIWFAQWNDEQTASTASVPAGDWVGHRLHQYRGGHNSRYGGVTMNIDSNYLDGDAAAASTGTAPIPDGTFVQVANTLPIYRIAGGAPLLVSDWSAFGGPQPTEVISQQQFDALNPVPASGTFLQTSAGGLYRVAGGAPLAFSSWSVFGGVQPSVAVDSWDLENASDPDAHLNPTPADGTIVEGLPSHAYWMFRGGALTEAAVNPFATQVDDTALAPYPELPCVVPALQRMTLARARAALRGGDCVVGRLLRLPRRRRRQLRRVIRQTPAAGTQEPPLTPVDLTLR